MGYILHASGHASELPRLVWFEGVGDNDLVRMTVANAVGILGVGVGHATELEEFGSGTERCRCSGELWVELTDDPHIWNVSIINGARVSDLRVNSFEFACAIQRVQLERLSYVGAPERNLTAGEISFEEELRSRQGPWPVRPAAQDS